MTHRLLNSALPMGRRYRKPQEDGLVEALLNASSRSPIFGLVTAAVLGAGGGYLWFQSKLWMGTAPIIGACVLLLGGFCLLVAAGSFIKSFMTLGKVSSVSVGSGVWTIQQIHDLNWAEFEQLVADLFRREGYQVEERGREAQQANTGDGGVDLILCDPKRKGFSYLVQCKQYRAWDVGEPRVRDFLGAMTAMRTNCEGIFITCGQFSQPAKDFAAKNHIRLVDGHGLLQMLNRDGAMAPAAYAAAPPIVQRASVAPAPAMSGTETPLCPKCGAKMRRQTATRGSRQGKPFWGCSNYPSCRMIINIDA